MEMLSVENLNFMKANILIMKSTVFCLNFV